jgi:type I restriction enzyme S subunit
MADTVRLGKVAKVISGYAFKSSAFTNSGVPVIKIANIRVGNVDLQGCQYVSQDCIDAIDEKYRISAGDVLISLTGSQITQPNSVVGRVARQSRNAPLCLLNQRVGKVIIQNPENCDKSFVYYALFRPETRRLLASMGHGAASQANVSPSQVETLEIPSLTIQHQRRIGAILSARDDLIENNTRRIQILEEMARRIYEEWFVQFRFPGNENGRLVETELGLAPDNWEVQSVTRLIEFDPRTSVPKEGTKPFVPMSSLAENSMLISEIESRAGNSGSKFKSGDTLFARVTPCLENGKTGFVDFLPNDDAVAFGSTEYIVLRSRTVTPEFVYLTARSERFRQHAIKSMSGATGRQRVRVDSFTEYLLAQPDSETLGKFSKVVSPMFKSISCLAKKNANLRTTRDLLLPKLISGEIDVSGLHIKMDGG